MRLHANRDVHFEVARVWRFQGDAIVKGGRGQYHDGRYGATRVGGTRTRSLIRRGGADGGFCIPFGEQFAPTLVRTLPRTGQIQIILNL